MNAYRCVHSSCGGTGFWEPKAYIFNISLVGLHFFTFEVKTSFIHNFKGPVPNQMVKNGPNDCFLKIKAENKKAQVKIN